MDKLHPIIKEVEDEVWRVLQEQYRRELHPYNLHEGAQRHHVIFHSHGMEVRMGINHEPPYPTTIHITRITDKHPIGGLSIHLRGLASPGNPGRIERLVELCDLLNKVESIVGGNI